MTEIIKTTACVLSDPRLPIPSLPTNRPLNGRNSEADIVELKDGRLLLAYSHYYGYGSVRYPSITFLSGDRVAIAYGARGGPWNLDGPRADDLEEGTWTNESNLPALQIQVIPLSWFYE